MSTNLTRALSTSFGIAACVGGIIGLGIMRTPGEIAVVIQDPLLYLLLWLSIGVFVLLCTACVVELVGMAPRSGGAYVLVRRAFGAYPGFLIGWIDWISFGATYALKAVVVVEFAALLAPELTPWITPGAVAITSLFASLQLLGARAGAQLQKWAAAFIALIMLGFTAALVVLGNVPTSVDPLPSPIWSATALGTAIAAVVFAYDGWLFASYFGGEIVGGGREVARACVRGIALVVVLYVLLNAALVYRVPLGHLVGQDLALAHALNLAVFDGAGLAVVVSAIAILLLQQNLGYMAGSRVLHALSRDGMGTRRATGVSTSGTPVGAVILTWMITVGLILAGGFLFLLNLTVLLYVSLYLCLLLGVFVLRRTEPKAQRPVYAWGHPYGTVIGVAGWLTVFGLIAYGAPESAGYAGAIVAISWPAYALMQHYRKEISDDPSVTD